MDYTHLIYYIWNSYTLTDYWWNSSSLCAAHPIPFAFQHQPVSRGLCSCYICPASGQFYKQHEEWKSPIVSQLTPFLLLVDHLKIYHTSGKLAKVLITGFRFVLFISFFLILTFEPNVKFFRVFSVLILESFICLNERQLHILEKSIKSTMSVFSFFFVCKKSRSHYLRKQRKIYVHNNLWITCILCEWLIPYICEWKNRWISVWIHPSLSLLA